MKKLSFIKNILGTMVFCVGLKSGPAFDSATFDLNATAQGDLTSTSVTDAQTFLTNAQAAIGLINTDTPAVAYTDSSCGDFQSALTLATATGVSAAMAANNAALSALLTQLETFIASSGATKPTGVAGAAGSTTTSTTTSATTTGTPGVYQDPIAFIQQQFKTLRELSGIGTASRQMTSANLMAMIANIHSTIPPVAPLIVNPADVTTLTSTMSNISDKLNMLLASSSVASADQQTMTQSLAGDITTVSNITLQNRLDVLNDIYAAPTDPNGSVFASSTGGEKRFLDLVNFIMNNIGSLTTENLKVFSWILEEAQDRDDYSAATKTFIPSLLAMPQFAAGYVPTASSSSSTTTSASGVSTPAPTIDFIAPEITRLTTVLGTLTTDGNKQFLDDCEKLANVYRGFLVGGQISATSNANLTQQMQGLKSTVQGNYRFNKDPEKTRCVNIGNIIDNNLSLTQKINDYSGQLSTVNSDASAMALFTAFSGDIVDSTNTLKPAIKALSKDDKDTLISFIAEMKAVSFFGAVGQQLDDLAARLTYGATFGESLDMVLSEVTTSSSADEPTVDGIVTDLSSACDRYNELRAKNQATADQLTKLLDIFAAVQSPTRGSSMLFRRKLAIKTSIDNLNQSVQGPLSITKLITVLSNSLSGISNSSSEADLSTQITDTGDLATRLQLGLIIGTATAADVTALTAVINTTQGMDLFSVDAPTLQGFTTLLTTVLGQADKYTLLFNYCTKVVGETAPSTDECFDFICCVNNVLYPGLPALTAAQVQQLKSLVVQAGSNASFTAAQKVDLNNFSTGIDKFNSTKAVTPVVSTSLPTTITASAVPVALPPPVMINTTTTTGGTVTTTTGGTVTQGTITQGTVTQGTVTQQQVVQQPVSSSGSLGRAVAPGMGGGTVMGSSNTPGTVAAAPTFVSNTRRRGGQIVR